VSFSFILGQRVINAIGFEVRWGEFWERPPHSGLFALTIMATALHAPFHKRISWHC